MARFFHVLSVLCCIGLAGCSSSKDEKPAADRLLAKVYNKSLYFSEIADMIPESVGPEDSAIVVSAYVQRWVRDQLLMYEAERNIPKDLNIDKLVRDYRASLVRFHFEQQIITEKLDSLVQESEVRDFYEKNIEQFQLESTILKCLFLKLPLNAPQSEMNRYWYGKSPSDFAKLKDFAREWAILSMLDKEKWYKLEELAALLPKGTLTPENVQSRREGSLSDGDHRYYYRILETAQGKSPAPYDYAREQAMTIILHQRKQQLIEKWKKDLYEKELRRNNIILY